MIRAVIFDLWGVLATKNPRVFDVMARDMHISNDARPYFIELLAEMEAGKLDEDGFWQRFCQSQQRERPTKGTATWSQYYQEITHINDDLLQLVQQLKHNGYKVAIISNIDKYAVQHMRDKGLASHFDITIFSCEVGLLKPDPAIYKLAIEQLGVQPAEAFFTDDKPAKVAGAKAVGLQAIVFTDTQSLRQELSKLINL